METLKIPYIKKECQEKRIIVMGGSFNPPTLAHQILMLSAIEDSGAQYGIFVPSNHDYVSKKMKRLKLKREVLSEDARLRMLQSMCMDDQRLQVNTCEYGRDPKLKTFETMETIQNEYSDAELWFLVGCDKISIIPRWHRSKEFLQKFKILITTRDELSPESIIESNPYLLSHVEAFRLLKEPEKIKEISSTKVRNMIRNGDMQAEELVHPSVWKILVEEWLKLDIDNFRGEYDFLSNFYEAPVEYDGLIYGNNEAAFQAQKCCTREEKIPFTQYRPGQAKRAGRQVKLRSDWEKVKVSLMKEIVLAKFTQNLELRNKLLQTGDRVLIEGNGWHDVFWGVDSKTGVGENRLGKILMDTREELKLNQK